MMMKVVLVVVLLLTSEVSARYLDFLPPTSDEDEWIIPYSAPLRRHYRREVITVTKKICGDDVAFKIFDVCPENCAHLSANGVTLEDLERECCAGRCSRKLLSSLCCRQEDWPHSLGKLEG